MLNIRVMTFTFFMDEILKSLLAFIQKQGFGVAVITVVAVFFYYRAEGTEAKMDRKLETIEHSFRGQLKEVEGRLLDCNQEREKLAVSIAELNARFEKWKKRQ